MLCMCYHLYPVFSAACLETIFFMVTFLSHSCWITDDSFFYSVNLVYFTLTFIFNSGILVTVASSICQMKQVYRSNLNRGADTEGKSWTYPERFRVSCKRGLTVMGLTCLMGTTWGLAFLGSGYVNYPVLYLFCIFNSSQGLLPILIIQFVPDSPCAVSFILCRLTSS